MKQDYDREKSHSHESNTLCRETIHEVKNKLHFILNNHEYMEKNLSQCTPDIAKEFNEIIRENRQGLLEALEMLVRTLNGPEDANYREKLCPEDILDDLLRSMGKQLNGIALKKDVLPGEDINLIGSGERLKLILSNLIGNSIQCFQKDFSGEKAIAIGISLSDRDSLVFRIADNGPGIPRENLDRVFESGFTTRKNAGGSGQGLAIVKNLVEKDFGGSISVSSERGKGTKFVFEVPLAGEEVERG